MKLLMVLIGGLVFGILTIYVATQILGDQDKRDKRFDSITHSVKDIYDTNKQIKQDVHVNVGNGKAGAEAVTVVNDGNGTKKVVKKTVKVKGKGKNGTTNNVAVYVNANNADKSGGKRKDGFDESWDKMNAEFNEMGKGF